MLFSLFNVFDDVLDCFLWSNHLVGFELCMVLVVNPGGRGLGTNGKWKLK